MLQTLLLSAMALTGRPLQLRPAAALTGRPRGRGRVWPPVQACEDAALAAQELAVLSLPSEPSPELSPADVVTALCRGLQSNQVPTPDAGIERVYHFTTYECRAALTARKGYKSGVERFVQHAMLYSLVECRSFRLVGEPTIIAGTQTRGAMASLAVDVQYDPGFRFKSGFERRAPPADADDGASEGERYLFTLQQERRPPLAGCWLVRSLMPAREHMLFNGDTGAVQG